MDVATGAIVVLLLAVGIGAYWFVWVSDPERSSVKPPTDAPPRNDPKLRIERILRRAKDRGGERTKSK
jgi:hypothetical protein